MINAELMEKIAVIIPSVVMFITSAAACWTAIQQARKASKNAATEIQTTKKEMILNYKETAKENAQLRESIASLVRSNQQIVRENVQLQSEIKQLLQERESKRYVNQKRIR